MLSRNKTKLIHSLKLKKFRERYGLFVAEGQKLVSDLVSAGAIINTIIGQEDWISTHKIQAKEIIYVTEKELKSVSQLKTISPVLALVEIPKISADPDFKNELVIGLDDIQDPGNLGTIIRTAHWFGIKNIVCSTGTVDCFNSKVIQSTMGSIASVNVIYTDLKNFILNNKSELWGVYGTFLDGQNIYQTEFPERGIIILGNEGSGIRPELESIIDYKLTIPNFTTKGTKPESLNVSVAASVICSEFRRRNQ